MDDHQQIARGFLGDDPQTPDLVRQPGGGPLDPVLNLDESLVQVGAQAEGQGQGHGPIGHALAEQVDHPIQTGHLLFQRSRHGGGDGFRAGAGITGVDGYGRGDDFRILADGQLEHRNRPEEDDHHGQHSGENRAIDEELG